MMCPDRAAMANASTLTTNLGPYWACWSGYFSNGREAGDADGDALRCAVLGLYRR
jgi:hypothetical protein